MVDIKELSIYYKNQKVLDALSFSMKPSRITAFIGESGAGKTTLLKALVGLVPIRSGEVLVDNKKVGLMNPKERAETIGYVFQDYNLFCNLTLLENCIDPLLVHGWSYIKAEAKVKEQLTRFGMFDFIDKYPSELSGGQQQRGAIARCLSLSPKVLLLDEPTSALDPKNTDTLVRVLKQLAASGLTIGVSSQDMEFVRKIFDEVYYLEAGKIKEFADDMNNLSSQSYIKKFISITK